MVRPISYRPVLSRAYWLGISWIACALWAAGVSQMALGGHGGPPPDLNGNGIIEQGDLIRLLGNFTGELHGEGTATFIEGDLDSDSDVDMLDAVYMVEHVELGPFCSVQGTADLIYDPATGSVRLSSEHTGCPIDVFVLRSPAGMLEPSRFSFPFGSVSGAPIFEASQHQIGELDRTLWDIHHFDLSLGRILPPKLTEAEFREAVSLTRYSSVTVPSSEFNLHVLPMADIGDADRDGDVDTADLTKLITNWTGSLEPGEADKVFDEGDFDFDGDVDAADLNIQITNWTGAQAGMPLAVPEPNGLAAAAMMLILLARRARGRVITR